MKLCADYSHFAVVTAAACDDRELNAVLALLAPRVRHIHARVGFIQGPQARVLWARKRAPTFT